MDYKELVEKLRNNNVDNNCHDCALGYYAFEAADAITDLLSRAEAAEERAEKAEGEINNCSACWMCVKNEDCHKGMAVKEPDCKCGDFKWRGQKEE